MKPLQASRPKCAVQDGDEIAVFRSPTDVVDNEILRFLLLPQAAKEENDGLQLHF